MDILHYTQDHHAFRQRLRQFLATQVIDQVERWEAVGIVPKSVWRQMGRQGFLCPQVGPEYGGLGGDFLYSVIVVEEIARTNHAGLTAPLHSDIVVPYITAYGSKDHKQIYLPGCVSGDCITAVAMTEPDAGSDLAAMSTSATEDGDTVVINGAKTFISNAVNADLIVLAARDPGEPNPHQAVSLYLVPGDTPGVRKGVPFQKLGFHSQDTAELFFTNCRIPKTNRLGQKGMGFIMLMEKLQQERLICAIMAVAAAECILAWTTDYLKTTLRSDKPLIKSQAVQFALVEMSTQIRVGRTFVDKLVADHMEGQNVVVETSMAKYWTTDMVKQLADRCLDLVGDFALLEACPIVRAWRDVRVFSIFAGTNEIMKQIAAKFMGF